MFHQRLNQKGFTAIEGLLILVILAIVGGTGYFIYHSNQKTSDTLSSSAKIAQSSPSKITKKKSSASPQTSAKSSTSTSPAQTYLTITQWGVQIPLSSAISDALYVYYGQSGTDDSGKNTYGSVFLSTKSYDTSYPKCSVETGAGPSIIGSIVRYAASSGVGTVIGNYSYAFVPPQASCEADSSAGQQQQATQMQAAFATAAKSIKAVSQ